MSRPKRDIQLGFKYKLLTVVGTISLSAIPGEHARTWRCDCDCGRTIYLSISEVGRTGSCGCRSKRYGGGAGKVEVAVDEATWEPPMFAKKPCPKCKGKMEASRYYACLTCKPIQGEEHPLYY